MEFKKRHRNAEENFFLPNFCAAQSYFVLCVGAEMIAILFILADGDVLWESWDELALLSLFVQWIAFVSAGIFCLSRRWLAKFSIIETAVIAWFIVVSTTGIFAAIAQFTMLKIKYTWGNVPETIEEFAIRCVMISGILAFFALRYLYVQQQWMQKIQLESEARVEALQARIRPHFLFNSMNIIASLIETQPKMAEQAVEDLSDLFRAILRDTGSMVPLAQEWILCRNYLRIEGLRLAERLKVDVDLSAVPDDAGIPMLTLQPLVENAIYHGIQPLEQGGTIKVRGTLEGNTVTIKLSNPVPSHSQPKAPSGNQIAMGNIGHRLNLLFGSHAKLKVNATDTDYEVVLTFPYLKSGL